MLVDPQTGSAAYRISGGGNGMSMDNEISTAVSAAGIFGGADIHINWPKVSADDGECGEGDNIQVPLMDMLTFSILMGWLLLDALGVGDEDCGCGANPAYNSTATLILWYRDVNKAFGDRLEGCLEFTSGHFANFANGLQDMSATTVHIAQAQNDGSATRLTWIKGEDRKPRGFYRNKDECSTRGSGALKYIADWGATPSECDEYPFNSTAEGNKVFYGHPDKPLSIKLVPATHNSAQGNALKGFYFRCNISTHEIFEVKTNLSTGSITKGNDKQGNQCFP